MSNTHYKVHGKALALCNAFGFIYPGELFLIQAIAQSLPKEAVCVNIGAGVGTSGLALVEIRPDLKVFTIDISQNSPNGGLDNERIAFANANISPASTGILGSSQDQKTRDAFLTASKSSKIDYLFIDGDHAQSALRVDINQWVPLVAEKGYILFHDYGSEFWGDVTAVVDEVINPKTWRYILKVDTMIAFQRRGK